MSSTKFQCQNPACDLCKEGSGKPGHSASQSMDFSVKVVPASKDKKKKEDDESESSSSHSKHSAPAVPKTQKCQYCGVLCASLNGHGAWCMQFPNSCPNFCKEYKIVTLPKADVIPHLRSSCQVTDNCACPYVQFGCTFRAANRNELMHHFERSAAAHHAHTELLTKAFMDVLWSDNAGSAGANYVIQWYQHVIKQKIAAPSPAETAAASVPAPSSADKRKSASTPATASAPATPLASASAAGKTASTPTAASSALTAAAPKSTVPAAPAAPTAPAPPVLRQLSSSDKLKAVAKERDFMSAREEMLATIKKRGSSLTQRELDPLAVAAGAVAGSGAAAAAARPGAPLASTAAQPSSGKLMPPPPKPTAPRPLPQLPVAVKATAVVPGKVDLKEHAKVLASVFPGASSSSTASSGGTAASTGVKSVPLDSRMTANSVAAHRVDLQNWKEQVTAVLEKKLENPSGEAGIQKLQRMMCYGRTFKRFHLHQFPTDESLFYRKTSATGTLHWCEGAGRNVTEPNSLPVAAITDIFLGKQAHAFKVSYADMAVEECCFSLVGLLPTGAGGAAAAAGGTEDASFVERRLDLEASTSKRRDAWLSGILAIMRAAGKEVKLHQSTTFGGIPAEHWYAWKESRVRSLFVYMQTHRASDKVKSTDDFKLDALAAMGFVDRSQTVKILKLYNGDLYKAYGGLLKTLR